MDRERKKVRGTKADSTAGQGTRKTGSVFIHFIYVDEQLPQTYLRFKSSQVKSSSL